VTVDPGSAIVVSLRDESQRAKAVEAIRAVDPGLTVSGQGDTIRVAYSEQDLFRKKKEVVDQSIEILRRRVDETATVEPTIMHQEDNRIVLQIPGIT
jgi:preprotein translocase subunit SecD